MWGVTGAAIQLVADGSVALYASASHGGGDCPFSYGMDVGARLYIHVDAPPSLPWTIPDFDVFPQQIKSAVQGGSCPPESQADALLSVANVTDHQLVKRASIFGPPFHLPQTGCLFCPNDETQTPTCNTDTSSRLVLSRQISESSWGDKRSECCAGAGKMLLISPKYPRATTLEGIMPLAAGPIRFYGFTSQDHCSSAFGLLSNPPQDRTSDRDWQVEHVLEFQTLAQFIDTQVRAAGQCGNMKSRHPNHCSPSLGKH